MCDSFENVIFHLLLWYLFVILCVLNYCEIFFIFLNTFAGTAQTGFFGLICYCMVAHHAWGCSKYELVGPFSDDSYFVLWFFRTILYLLYPEHLEAPINMTYDANVAYRYITDTFVIFFGFYFRRRRRREFVIVVSV